jgi:hypothetical protein
MARPTSSFVVFRRVPATHSSFRVEVIQLDFFIIFLALSNIF